jgi:hypothetical protein
VTDLAITARCLEQDLLEGLDPEVAEHVVEVFVERRGQDRRAGRLCGGSVARYESFTPTSPGGEVFEQSPGVIVAVMFAGSSLPACTMTSTTTSRGQPSPSSRNSQSSPAATTDVLLPRYAARNPGPADAHKLKERVVLRHRFIAGCPRL